ncbi:MAG: hypothetical protein EZS28_049307, partial [Streblomastix strix]
MFGQTQNNFEKQFSGAICLLSGKGNWHIVLILTCPSTSIQQSIGTALVHSIGLLDYLVTYITALSDIVNVAPVNYGLASSLNIENSVQVDDDEVLGLECVTYIDIQAL